MAVWTASLFPFLPLDVLHLVGVVAQPSDLCSMLQVSKALNKTLTPILYSHIELDAWDPILVCMKTLGCPSNERSFGRVLEVHVRSLVIKRPAVTRKPFYASSGAIGDALLKALPRMVNLKHFSSGIGLSPCSSDIFYLLATGSCASLQSIALQVLDEIPTALERRDRDEIESSTLQVPRNLRRLALELPIGSSAQRSFIRQLLRTCAPTLRVLSMTIDGHYLTGTWEHFLPSDADFIRLEDLDIEFEALSHPSLQRAVNVRSLKLLGSRGAIPRLRSGVLPNLRALSCLAEQLSKFLPRGADHRRPIATVCIGNASYRSSDDDSWNRPDPSSWRDVFASLQHLRYSAVPVTSLTVDVAAIPLAGVQAAQPYLATLEYLDIVLHRAYKVDSLRLLASELITHLPHLHTLLISTAPPTGLGPGTHVPSFVEMELTFAEAMRLSRRVILGFEDKPSTLRRLALSADIEWHKKDDRWHWEGDPRYYGERRGSLDDPPDYQDGSSECEDEAADDSSEGEDCGSSEDETVCVDSGYEDEREGVDDGCSEGEAPEGTRSLPLPVDVWVDDDGTRYQYVG